jgi:hypothetical protein
VVIGRWEEGELVEKLKKEERKQEAEIQEEKAKQNNLEEGKKDEVVEVANKVDEPNINAYGEQEAAA